MGEDPKGKPADLLALKELIENMIPMRCKNRHKKGK
jgi:hypothetical protein